MNYWKPIYLLQLIVGVGLLLFFFSFLLPIPTLTIDSPFIDHAFFEVDRDRIGFTIIFLLSTFSLLVVNFLNSHKKLFQVRKNILIFSISEIMFLFFFSLKFGYEYFSASFWSKQGVFFGGGIELFVPLGVILLGSLSLLVFFFRQLQDEVGTIKSPSLIGKQLLKRSVYLILCGIMYGLFLILMPISVKFSFLQAVSIIGMATIALLPFNKVMKVFGL